MFNKLLDDLNKTYGGQTVIIRKASELPPLRTFPLGIPTLDYDLGGGMLWGRTLLLAGDKGTGKTSTAYHASGQARQMAMPTVWFDLEKSFDLDRAKLFGVDPNMLYVVRGELTAENVFGILRDTVKSISNQDDSRCLFVVDSIAGMVSDALFETEASQQFGGSARMINQSVMVWNILLKENQLLLLINELRDKLGGMGEPDMMPGGRAQEYVASQTLWTRAGVTIKESSEAIGQEMKWTIKKSRSSAPKETGVVNYYYATGFDTVSNLVDVALEMGILKQGGPYYELPDGTKIRGKETFLTKLKEDSDFMDSLHNLVYSKMPVPNWNGVDKSEKV